MTMASKIGQCRALLPIIQNSHQQINSFSTSQALQKAVAARFSKRSYRFKLGKPQILTYEMYRRPQHIGGSKSWMSAHTQNLEEFRQQQSAALYQDEIIRRFVRAICFNFLPETLGGSELVIKRRGNVVYVSGFMVPKSHTRIDKVYWLYGFTEEILSCLLKQPVKLELQIVRSENDLAHCWYIPPSQKN